MSEGKRSLISCIGNSNVKKWNFENDNKKRRLESDENSTSDSLFRLSQIDDKGSCFTSTQHSKTDGAGPSKPKYAPKPFVAPVNSRVDTKLPEETPNEDNDELSSIDAYFASLEKKNEVFQRPRQSLAGFRPPDRPTFAPKTSMAGIPSAIPSRPLKENKAKVIPNYIKKSGQGRENDMEDTIDYSLLIENAVDNEKVAPQARGFQAIPRSTSGGFVMPQRQDLAPKTSMAGLPSAIPSRPLKENKAKVIPNYIKKTRQGRENDFDDMENTTDDLDKHSTKARAFVKPQRQDPFKTASHQLAINAAKKNPQSGSSTPRNGPYNSFKSPLLQQQKPEEQAKSEENPIDPRLKNIEPKMIELIENEIMDNGTEVRWDEIAGLEFVKTTVKEIVVFPLLRPDIFHGLRAPPKGLLLFGPPGTGKTMIGKCIASQSKSTFFAISASSLTSKWVGEGEKMVRALFAVARVHQPSVVFIDEIDSVLSSRSDTEHESSRRIKTEFLVQLDGASTVGEERILVIGATNRPKDLDEAARRRLSKRLYVPLPESSARVKIIENMLESQSHHLESDELEKIGEMTDGYSGSDMSCLCREAAMGPIRCLDYSQIDSIQPDDVRPMNFVDFNDALRQVKASVSDKDLQMYHDWNSQYGSTAK